MAGAIGGILTGLFVVWHKKRRRKLT